MNLIDSLHQRVDIERVSTVASIEKAHTSSRIQHAEKLCFCCSCRIV